MATAKKKPNPFAKGGKTEAKCKNCGKPKSKCKC